MRTLTGLMIVAMTALLAISPQAAHGDGLPVIGLDTTRSGVASLDGRVSYYAVRDRGRTSVLRIDSERERSLRSMSLRGTLAVPGVAWDGTTSGLSADGRILALIAPRRGFPRDRTRLVLVRTRDWKVAERIALRGDFSFDAISPDGSTIYLIHYLNPRRPTEYEVRAYDTTPGRLLPEPVIDERVAEATMNGFPMTRATGPGGVWEYTLYNGDGKTFVHALNTAAGTAFCVDLPIGQRGIAAAELAVSPDGGTVTVSRRDVPVASINTATWTATKLDVVEATNDTGEGAGAAAEDGAPLALRWVAGLALLALLGSVALGTLRRRRRPVMPPDPLPDLSTGPGAEPANRRAETANVERAAR